METRPAMKRKKRTLARRKYVGKLLAAAAVCLLLFSTVSDTLAVNTYVRDLKGLAIPVETYRVDKPVVALTFDVGASGDRLSDILLELKQAGVRATFFMTGDWVAQHPQTAQAIVQQGHEVGQSLYAYRRADGMTVTDLQAELQKTDAAWRKACLPTTSLFRAPYGETQGNIAKVVRGRQEQLISWSINAAPEVPEQVASVAQGLTEGVQAGDIIRLRTDKLSAKLLPDLLRQVRDAGYEWRTITEMQGEVQR